MRQNSLNKNVCTTHLGYKLLIVTSLLSRQRPRTQFSRSRSRAVCHAYYNRTNQTVSEPLSQSLHPNNLTSCLLYGLVVKIAKSVANASNQSLTAKRLVPGTN